MLRAVSTQPTATAALDHQLDLTVQACERAELLPADLETIRRAAARD
jgi:hypothetical protein